MFVLFYHANLCVQHEVLLSSQALYTNINYYHLSFVILNCDNAHLPGFGNDEIDYSNPLNQGDEYGFCTALMRRGFENISVMPLQRYEWIRVAGGLFDIPNFYTGNCKPDGMGYGWYIKRLRSTIEKAYQNAGSEEKVIVIGHSAGGW